VLLEHVLVIKIFPTHLTTHAVYTLMHLTLMELHSILMLKTFVAHRTLNIFNELGMSFGDVLFEAFVAGALLGAYQAGEWFG